MGNLWFPWARTVQKPITGVCGTKPAWQAQKGRGKGKGEGKGKGKGEGGVGEGEKREREKKGRCL